MKLIYYPHRSLRAPALPNPSPADLPRWLLDALPENGVGLAATQVDRPDRVAVALVDPGETEFDERLQIGERDGRVALALVNPSIVEASTHDTIEEHEGCLSFPDIFLHITRPGDVSVTTARGLVVAHGHSARVLQHEVDHLDGKLIIDHVSPELRDRAKRRMLGWHRAKGRAA